MKVLFLVSHLNSGGTERTVAYLSGYFAEHGVDTCVLSISNEKFYELGKAVRYETLNIPQGNKNPIDKIVKIAKRTFAVRRAIKKEAPDAVISLLSVNTKYLPAKKKYALIVSERNNPGAVTDRRAIKVRNRAFRICDGIVFQTKRAMDYYPEEVRKKGVVIPNAIGNELVYTAKVPEARAKKICAMGRLHPQKNYPLLLRAFCEILKDHPDYTLEIYGEGPEKGRLEALSKELGLEQSVKFQGSHPDAILKILDASCYVLSSRYEGMPNALMEAMAVGLPCVATDCPNGPAELIENGKNGLLVPNDDKDALVAAIKKIIETPAFAETCSKNAKQVLQLYSMDVNAEKYLEFIKSIYER
ncbi:MAG: glycosyltransferase family 4 protein [Clostridia bacterium]|nr:glycosyltransferase family 4 protein [Clostridia bacterium]